MYLSYKYNSLPTVWSEGRQIKVLKPLPRWAVNLSKSISNPDIFLIFKATEATIFQANIKLMFFFIFEQNLRVAYRKAVDFI